MDEYIDRGALIEWLKRIRLIDLSDGRGLCRVIMEDDFKKAIKKMPKGIIADVAPVRHGRWIMKHKHRGGFRRYTGIDDMGEQHTIIVDERVEYDDRYCSECGKQSADNFLNYCPNCGAKMGGGVDDACL